MTFQRIRKSRWLIPIGVLITLILATSGCTQKDTGGFSVNENFRLKSGEQRTGDQVITASRITLEPDSSIVGNVTFIGDQVAIDAEIDGDVVIIADQLKLGDSAHITGDLSICATNWDRLAGATIGGDLSEECTEGGRVTLESVVESGVDGWRGSFFFRLGSTIGSSLLFGAIAALGTVIWPQPLIRVSDSIRHKPLITGGVGCLTILVTIGLTVIYIISLLLILPIVLLPGVLLGWAAVGIASVFGWIALAEPFGQALLRRTGLIEPPPMVAAAVGGVILTLMVRMWSIFWFTGWIGAILSIVLGSIGLGAVVLTRLGRHSYPNTDPDAAVIRSI